MLQLVFSVIELLILMSVSFYLISLSYSWLKGAPYVGTQNKEINEILKRASLKKNQVFLELGCGDGRVLKTAVKNFGVQGIGVDINMFLIWFCKISSAFQGLKNISFLNKDVRTVDFRKPDVIYIFLFPKLVETLKNKLTTETKKNVIIIAHGFKIKYLSKYLKDTRKGNSFNTYFYQIK